MADTVNIIASADDAHSSALLQLAELLPTIDKYYVDQNNQPWLISTDSHTLASGISRNFSQVSQGICQALDQFQYDAWPALTQRALAVYGLALLETAWGVMQSGCQVSHPNLQNTDGTELQTTVRNATWLMPPTANLYEPETGAGFTEFWVRDEVDQNRLNIKELSNSLMQYSSTSSRAPVIHLPGAGTILDAYGTPLLTDDYLMNDCRSLYDMAEAVHGQVMAVEREETKSQNRREEERQRAAARTQKGKAKDR